MQNLTGNLTDPHLTLNPIKSAGIRYSAGSKFSQPAEQHHPRSLCCVS